MCIRDSPWQAWVRPLACWTPYILALLGLQICLASLLDVYKRQEPGQDLIVHDIVRGDVAFRSDDLDDFVIVKGDGFPVYNWACVVDDTAMRISHVIRAEEHLSNTPRQILLYQAMGYDLPRFCHVPVVLNTCLLYTSRCV